MSAVNAPFGFRPVNHEGGAVRARRYAVASGYGTAMYKGQPCILNTNGTVTVGAAAADLLGVLHGFEFVDPTGKPTVSTFWPAGQTVLAGTVPYAWVYDDQQTVYEVQASGAVAATAVGDQADVINVGNNANGLSTCGLNATLVGAAAQGQFRVIGFTESPEHTVGDAFTLCLVKLARSHFVANKAAI